MGEPERAPVVISYPSGVAETIESVAIGDSQHARFWLVGGEGPTTLKGAPTFRPPEPSWYYIYVSSQPTRFSDGETPLLGVKEPAVTIFPPGMSHEAELDGPAFVFGVASRSGEEIDPSAWPKTAKVARIETALWRLGDRPVRLVVGSKLKGEEDWEDRDWSFEDEGDSITGQVIVNKTNDLELSVANGSTRQAAHIHQRTFELFASFADMRVYWRYTKEESQVTQGPTIVMISPSFCHSVRLSGTTYIFQTSIDRSRIGDDTTRCEVSD
jgi:hypothetical protein